MAIAQFHARSLNNIHVDRHVTSQADHFFLYGKPRIGMNVIDDFFSRFINPHFPTGPKKRKVACLEAYHRETQRNPSSQIIRLHYASVRSPQPISHPAPSPLLLPTALLSWISLPGRSERWDDVTLERAFLSTRAVSKTRHKPLPDWAVLHQELKTARSKG